MTTQLTEKQVVEVFELLKGSDAVELKVTVPESEIRSTADLLGMDPLDAEIRQVVFFDTPDLTLSQAGIVVSCSTSPGWRRRHRGQAEARETCRFSLEIRRSESVKVEVDAMPRGFVCSASMKGKASAAEIRSVILGKNKIKSLFSKEQRDFYRSHCARGPAAQRSFHSRTHQHSEIGLSPHAARPEIRCGAVALPGWIADSRAIHEVHSGKRVSSSRRDS